MYRVKTPFWLPATQSSYLTWKGPKRDEPTVYLTFDDGPHPVATPFVLDELAKADVKATFFCIGKNVAEYPEIYQRIIDDGHSIGNHTQDHLNGWKTSTEVYIGNIAEAGKRIHSRLFRPPYGRIKRVQAALLAQTSSPFSIIMWDVLSADFDINISAEKCLKNVLSNAQPRSIIVFHDSAKAWDRMRYALPRSLEFFSEKGWKCDCLDSGTED